MQTPQIFSTPIILQAYAAIMGTGRLVTDEVSAVQRMGVNIALLRNDEWNFKITIPRDLELAEHVLASRAGSLMQYKLSKTQQRNPAGHFRNAAHA